MSAGAARPDYRPDIDGLRALAVVGVILYHAGVPFVPGGYLGVDVFFVISGYLITTILLVESDAGGINFRRFYERRVRRIFPALVLVLTCCVPFAFWLMLPETRENFGQSLFATIAFANNIKLAITADYWDQLSAQDPLLHTWSLGVEEQFYIAFPLALALLARGGRRAQVVAFSVAGVIGFALAEASLRSIGNVSFFLPTSRAWELMVGCVAAYAPRKARALDGPLTLASLLAIAGSMALIGDVATPSAWCLPAVLGTAALLVCNREGLPAARHLSLRPIVWVGLVSYSAYLWHQPLFAFARLSQLTPPSAPQMTLLTALTFILAGLSWRFVEQPFRDARRTSFRQVIALAIAPAAVLAALGLVLHFNRGFPRWTYPDYDTSAPKLSDYNEAVREWAAGPFPENGRPNLLVVGNSFGRDVANLLVEARAAKDKNLVYLMEEGTCPVPRTDRPDTRLAVSQADVLVVALSGEASACIRDAYGAIERMAPGRAVYVGTKYFGQNINPYGRVPLADRTSVLADAGETTASDNRAVRRFLPQDRFIDLLGTLGPDGRHIRIFDGEGNPITEDRLHLTHYGTRFVADRLVDQRSPGLARIANAKPHRR